MSQNKVILIGNIGNDPEINVMPSGSSVANFTLATSEKWKDKQSGETKEKTEWHRCVVFDRGNYLAAQYIQQGVQKGTKLYVDGKLETREWEKDGVKRYTTEIKVDNFEILSGGIPKDGQQSPAQNQSFQQQAPAPKPQSFGSFGNDPWADYQPAGKAANMTMEQIKSNPSVNGNLQAAINAGVVTKKPVPKPAAPSFNDFDDDIPF